MSYIPYLISYKVDRTFRSTKTIEIVEVVSVKATTKREVIKDIINVLFKGKQVLRLL